jgi:hypothetical protein
MAVSEHTVLDALRQVPAERWGEVLSFVESMKSNESSVYTAADLLQSGLVGLWADRDDIGDPIELARRLRHEAETRRGTADAAGL